ncbi:ArsR/SmtB family transcription factor [Streptomyces sp. NPDC019443]|jgi:DNA-binding transcriptional ArsR family regulator|uniref:ArsR/SmtB family transcription factor n=1 Tax=Streptomyces sp. NPDC019443 TaxID=3365061 RepID=UPI003793B5D4
MPEIPEEQVHELDPRTLRGLAHPLRMRLLSKLRADGPATASQLAAALGESSGATSYHLRQLAAHGFVEDAPEHGKGRERWWKASYQSIRFNNDLYSNPDPSVRGAANFFIHEVASIHGQELTTFVGTLGDWPKPWIEAADLSDWTLRLTPELTDELNEKMHQLIESYRELEVETGTQDSAQVRFHLHAFPRATD